MDNTVGGQDIGDNQLGLAAPMLAQPLKNAGHFQIHNMLTQPKLDGHRCLVNRDGAYSRRGKPIDTIGEILDSINLPDDVILDGELYAHGKPLQTIASWAKRRQPNTLLLQYHIYDVIIPGERFQDRLTYLHDVITENQFVRLVPTYRVKQGVDPYELCKRYIAKGYEGGILRHADGKYDIGKRSKNLIKVKMRHDEEFECVDIERSKDDWGVLILKTKDGKLFKTSAPGDHGAKKYALDHKEQFIGKLVTCEYADLTKDGIPFHCVAIRWRDDL